MYTTIIYNGDKIRALLVRHLDRRCERIYCADTYEDTPEAARASTRTRLGGGNVTVTYDPAQQYEIKVWDVEYRRDPVRTLMARIYQPQGGGPFPALLDVHGGAWNDQDRTANALVDERLAGSGILVVAIDVRLAREAPYPASVADANYGIRWLKQQARTWNGDPETVGALGS